MKKKNQLNQKIEAVGAICRLPGRGVRESNVFSQRQGWL